MTSEANKAVARVWFEEVMNKRHVSAIDRAYAPDYVHRGPGGGEIRREEAKAVARRLIEAVPDRVATVVSQVAEADMVVTRWQSRGTEKGSSLGESSTGRTVVAQGIVMSRIADGMIVEDWEMVHLGHEA